MNTDPAGAVAAGMVKPRTMLERVAWNLDSLSSDELNEMQRLLDTPPGEQLAGIIGTAMLRTLTGEEAVAALVLLAQVREDAA